MFENRGFSANPLSQLEIRILELIKPKSQTESKIAKTLKVDPIVLSPVVTDLILKGYLELFRRRRLHFISREFCTITVEGISALENARSPFRNFIEMIQDRAANTVSVLGARWPALKIALFSARMLYKLTKALV